jgi:hypothetical protein
MFTRLSRGLSAVVLTAAVLTGCGDDAGDGTGKNTGTDSTTGSPTSASASAQVAVPTSSIVGLLKSADNEQVVITLPGGATRTFGVRPEDRPRLGIRHLASHAGLTDIGFKITYVTVDGKDYVVAAEETAPPK